MEQALEGTNEGQSKTASANKVGTPWGITVGPVAYHVSSDTSLFSSSLPVLPHEKLTFNEAGGEGCVKVDDIFPELSPSRLDNELKDPLDDLELSPLGSFLPGDEDELLAGIVNEFGPSRQPTQLEDLEDDLFGSGGGLELESRSHEHNLNGISNLSLSDGILGNNVGHCSIQNGGGTVSGEHPYGEHPSRTLFVRNINSNIEDSELQAVFEQFGEIRTLYTACKHRGFVMVSYYDIRAARTALRSLQNKPMRRRKLDIHFSIPKDNPSEKDINQGTLVVFNLDPSVSNEDLHQIFSLYGEVKEIRETPHKRQHKFVEYYDVRAAEAALKALNRIEIAGKRIKLELSRPGGARRSMVQQLSQDLERDDARAFSRHIGSPLANSLPGSWPNSGSPVELNLLNGYNQSPNLGMHNSMNSHHMPGLESILPQLGPIPAKISPIGKESERVSHGNQVFLNVNSNKRMVNEHSHPISEQKLGSSPGVVTPFAVSKSNSSSIGTLSGPEFLWGSPTIHSERSWPPSEMSNMFGCNKQGHGYPYPTLQGSSLSSHHHVGSAPTGVPLQRHFGFFPESSKTSYINSDAFNNSATYPNDSDFLMNIGSPAIINMGMTFAGNFRESGRSSSRLMIDSRNNPLFLGNGSYGRVGVIQQNGLIDYGGNKRFEGNQNDNKKQFQLNLEKIFNGEDTRTTLMIKNIPNKYTSKMLLAAIDETHKGTYDFLYLPIDFKNKCNVGYAFINIVSPSHIITFYKVFHGKKWEKFNSEKVASLAYARIQGKPALVAHFQNSSLMNEDKQCRPIVFQPGGQGNSCQEALISSSLNICIQQPDGSYSTDASGKPKE